MSPLGSGRGYKVFKPTISRSDFGPITSTNRGSALKLLGAVGQNRSGPLGPHNSALRLQDTLPESSTNDNDSCAQGSIFVKSREMLGASSSGGGYDSEGCNRVGPDNDSRVLQSDIPSSETWGPLETGYRSLGFEHLHRLPLLPYGNTSLYTEDSSERPMVNLVGSQGRIFSCSDPSQPQTLPTVLSQGYSMAVQSPAIWPVHSTTGFYQGVNSGASLCTFTRSQASYVPRRLATQSGHQGGVVNSYSLANRPVYKARLGCERGEVGLKSVSVSGLFGNSSGHQARFSLPVPPPLRQMVFPSEGVHCQAGSTGIAVATHIGSSSLSREASQIWQGSDTSCATTATAPLESEVRLPASTCSVGSGLCGVSQMVVGNVKFDSRRPLGDCRHSLLPLHGQQLPRLGCTCPISDGLRSMDRSYGLSAYQPPRAECHLAGSQSLCQHAGQLHCGYHVRQYGCYSLCEKSGGDEVARNERSGESALPLGRAQKHDSSAQTSPWSSQRVSRPVESREPSSQNRVESEPVHSGQDFQSLGQASCRPIRPQPEQETGNLHGSHSGARVLESRQFGTLLEGTIRLCVPSNIFNQSMSEQDSSRQDVTDSDSPSVASAGVVYRPTVTDSGLSNNTAPVTTSAEADVLSSLPWQSGRAESSRLSVISGFAKSKGFSDKVSERISVPQRGSTLKLYEYKWKIFREWCQSRGFNPVSPTVPIIADFLLYLFEDRGLSVSAIKGYRSSLSQITQSLGIDITHDASLRALIQSFSIERPIARRSVPRWDLMIVLRHLMRAPYEPMSGSSLADLTRKTAFLVALASAKRTSELWAFSANVAYGHELKSATLTFVPGFMAKTYRPGRPETDVLPVTFPALAPTCGYDMPERNLCPVRALRYYTKETKVGVNPERSKKLFIAHKSGHSGDIVKTTISGWIKSVIRSAYGSVRDEDIPHLTHTEFQARELRAMATSLAFHQHNSLRQVMEAASWRAEGTFASFYLRDMNPPSSSLGSLVAGQTVVASLASV